LKKKKPSQKRASGIAQGVALSSSPSTAKIKNNNILLLLVEKVVKSSKQGDLPNRNA
jgi:hypothetical protein